MSDLEYSYPELKRKAEYYIEIQDPLYYSNAVNIIKALLEALKNDRADILMYTSIASTVYDHVTGGMISKPNTDAAVIMSVHDDYVQQLMDEAGEDAVKEAREEWEAELEPKRGDN